MPAIITHHQFGREMLALPATSFIHTKEEANAFLLGNQGPDPLFFCVLSPALVRFRTLGSLMHDKKPSDLLAALLQTIQNAPTNTQTVVRAFVAGFFCHYLLDRAAHPFIYSQQFAICDAGIEGLSRDDGHEVHAVIESELDEMILYTHANQTIATFVPYKEILKANEQTLAAISHAICSAFWETYERLTPAQLFSKSVHNYRLVERATYSPQGAKRKAYGTVERRFRKHSFAQAFSHRDIALEESAFDNHEHHAWENPFTGDINTTSFEDIFANTLSEANSVLAKVFSRTTSEASSGTKGDANNDILKNNGLDELGGLDTSTGSPTQELSRRTQGTANSLSQEIIASLSEEEARLLTRSLNFSGQPVQE